MAALYTGYKRTLVIACLFLIFLAQTVVIAWRQSNTWDEPTHIMAGYSLLSNGTDPSPREHPAFGRIIQGILPSAVLKLDFDAYRLNYDYDPALRVKDDRYSNYFPYSIKFLFQNGVDGRRILFLSRLANIILGVVLGIYIVLWAGELWGERGACLSLFLYALSPDVIAHSSLATTDMPVTVFFFITAFYVYRFACKPNRVFHSTKSASLKGFEDVRYPDALAGGLFLGLALATKFTALLLLPMAAAAFAVGLRRHPLKHCVLWFGALFLTAYACVWCVYGFRFRPDGAFYEPLFWGQFAPSPIAVIIDFMRRWRLLPEAYLYGLRGIVSAAGGARASFFMGDYSMTGWWYYFIAAFFIKTPIAALILLFASVLYAFKNSVDRALFLIFPATVVYMAMSRQNVHIGLRHVLPALPFLITLSGFAVNIRTVRQSAARLVFYGLMAWHACAAAIIFPHNLAYFNEFVGGPENGWRYLVDSNLDWGQDLTGLKRYMDENGIRRINLAYFGLADPRHYGIEYDYLPSNTIIDPQNLRESVPLRGWFAISATMLQGVYLADRGYYRVFQGLKPVATIGYSIFIYKL